MPTYNYICEECNEEFEQRRKISEMDTPTEEPCPECGKEESIRRKIYANIGFRADVPPPLNSDFKQTMNAIKKANPGSTMPDY